MKKYFSYLQYAILLILIFILEIAAGIYAYTKKDTVLEKFKTEITEAVKNSYGGSSKSDEGLTEGVNWFQENVSPKN